MASLADVRMLWHQSASASMHDARCTAHAPHVGAGGAGGVGNWLAIDGGFGVEIFFVLSGFLITWMLRGELDKTGSIGLVDFYRRRAARLLPVFYAYLLFGMMVLLVLGKPVPWAAVWASAFYVVNYYQAFTGAAQHYLSHCWSLAVEEQFYLLWPLLLLALTRLRRDMASSLLMIIAAVWVLRLILVLSGTNEDYLYRALETRADQLAIGGLLACVIGTARGRDFFERMPGKPFLVLAILVALDVSLLTTRGATFSKYVVGYTVEPVLVALLIPFVIPGASGRALGWFLNAAPVNMVGKISYGVYLFHPFILSPVRRVVEHASGQAAVGIAASVLVVLGVALLSFRYFESPVRERLRAT